jgi:hypothetical protein
MAGVLSTPRPRPARLAPVLAAGIIIVAALPVFAAADWPLKGWALGAVLWVASQGIGLLLTRLRLGADNLAASGVLAFGMMFRAIAVVLVLILVALSDPDAALAAALLYAAAYTFELGLSLASYFSGDAV